MAASHLKPKRADTLADTHSHTHTDSHVYVLTAAKMATVTWLLPFTSLSLALSRSVFLSRAHVAAWPLTVTFTSLSRIQTLPQVAGCWLLAAGSRLQVAHCCLRCPNGIFEQKGEGVCCYLTLDFLSLMKCGYKCNFTFFKKHFICRRQAREHSYRAQTQFPAQTCRTWHAAVCVSERVCWHVGVSAFVCVPRMSLLLMLMLLHCYRCTSPDPAVYVSLFAPCRN